MIMLLKNGRKTVDTLTECRKTGVLAYADRGFKSLFIKGYILTNAL